MTTSPTDDRAASNAKPLGDTTSPGGRAVRPNLIFAITVTAMMMASLDQSIIATALPTLEHDLHSPLNWAGWTITAYQFGLVMALPVAGRISDQFGRKRVFMICLAAFTISSFCCAISTNIYMLVGFRTVQALGGGAFTPSTIGIITDHFGKNRDRAVGMISSTVPFGSLAGPVLGGVIIGYWNWRGVFLINVPVGIVVFVLGMRHIPTSRARDAAPTDVAGIALLGGIILPFMYGVTAFGRPSTPITSTSFVVPIAASALCTALFLRHAKRAESPFIPMRLLFRGGFGTLNVINFLYGGCALGIGAMLPLYAEHRYHFSPIEAGSVLTTRAVGVLLIASTTAFLLRRVGYRRPMIVGFGVAGIGMVLLSQSPHGLSTYAWLAVGAGLMGVGNGIAAPSTNNAMLATAPHEAGAITGLRGMFRQFGAITVISMSTAYVTRNPHPGLALGHVFLVLAVVVTAIVVPLTFKVADHRGTW